MKIMTKHAAAAALIAAASIMASAQGAHADPAAATSAAAVTPNPSPVKLKVLPGGRASLNAQAGVQATSGPYNIRAVHSGKCADVLGGTGATGNGVPVQQYTCLGGAQTNQQWYFEQADSTPTYYIRARHSGKCLDVVGGPGATGDGARIQQYTCLGYNQTNQRWYLTTQDNGQTVNIRAVNSGKCLDVIGGTGATADGIRLQQYTCLGYNQTNQRWYLTTP